MRSCVCIIDGLFTYNTLRRGMWVPVLLQCVRIVQCLRDMDLPSLQLLQGGLMYLTDWGVGLKF